MVTTSTDLLASARTLDDEFVRHANAKDATALSRAFYAEDAILLPPGAPRIDGIEAIRAFWQAFIDRGVEDVWIETPRVEESGDLGWGVGTYTCTWPSADGGRVTDTGTFLVVYRRQANGGWKVIADQLSSDLPTT